MAGVDKHLVRTDYQGIFIIVSETLGLLQRLVFDQQLCRDAAAAVAVACLAIAPRLLRATTETGEPASPFATVDVFVTSGQPLAAYQVEVKPAAGKFLITGVEGGEHEQFMQPPYYDRNVIEASGSDRVIIGAFTTADAAKLPKGKVRVARLHVFIEGNAPVRYDAKLVVAGTAGGRKISAKVTVEEGTAE